MKKYPLYLIAIMAFILLLVTSLLRGHYIPFLVDGGESVVAFICYLLFTAWVFKRYGAKLKRHSIFAAIFVGAVMPELIVALTSLKESWGAIPDMLCRYLGILIGYSAIRLTKRNHQLLVVIAGLVVAIVLGYIVSDWWVSLRVYFYPH
jgi:putative flippase GtrA